MGGCQAVCDALGNPTQLYLTQGQAHDLQGADALLSKVEADFFLADKAYSCSSKSNQQTSSQKLSCCDSIEIESNSTTGI